MYTDKSKRNLRNLRHPQCYRRNSLRFAKIFSRDHVGALKWRKEMICQTRQMTPRKIDARLLTSDSEFFAFVWRHLADRLQLRPIGAD